MSFTSDLVLHRRDQDTAFTTISQRAEELLLACPSLSQVTGTASNRLPDLYAVKRNPSLDEPLSDPARNKLSLDLGSDLRFWVPSPVLDVCRSHRTTCCGMREIQAKF